MRGGHPSPGGALVTTANFVFTSSHRTLVAAQRALRRLGGAWEIRVGGKVRGDVWFADTARNYPLAPRTAEVRQ